MKITKYKHENTDFISIKNNTDLELILSPFGAGIYAIKFEEKYMTMTPEDMSYYSEKNMYYGKTIGPVANRIKDGIFTINDIKYKTEQNEGNNSLHSGSECWCNKTFSTNIKQFDSEIIVKFSYLAKDNEGGFPGNVKVEIVYKIFANEPKFTINFNVISDADTLIGLTNHAYYCMGESHLKNLQLRINADRFVHPSPIDLIPLEMRNVNKIMDFRNLKSIVEYIDDPYLVNSKSFGYDHHFCFVNVNPNIPQITLVGSKYQMDIYTDFSGVQIYCDNYSNNIKFYNSSTDRRRGIAIEPEEIYLSRDVLKANKKYCHFISYIFSKFK